VTENLQIRGLFVSSLSLAIAAPRPLGPPGRPLLGNILDFGRDLNGFLERCAREYGPIVKLRMVHRAAYLIADPELNEYVLLGNYRNFVKHQMFFSRVRRVFGWGLLSADGDQWRKQRRLAAPGFHRDRIAEYGRIMSDYAAELVGEWRDGEVRDMYVDMRDIASKVVARALFDEDVAGDVAEVGSAMDDLLGGITERMLHPLVAPDWAPTRNVRRYRRAVARIDKLVARFMSQHRKNLDERGTLLAMLMQARDEDGQPMPDAQIRDEAITLFVAGHDTTATALSWTLYLLTQHPQWQETLHAAVDQALAGRAPQAADLAALQAVEWTVRESMRLYPPVSLVARQAVDDCEIGGYPIAAGSLIYISPWAMQRDPRYFNDANDFKPERWSDGLDSRLPRYVFMPFGGGPRTCIGDRFAIMEAVLLLASFVQQFEFEYAGDKPPKPFASITLIPVGGVPVRLRRRSGATGK